MERPTEGAFGAARRVERACVAMRKVRIAVTKAVTKRRIKCRNLAFTKVIGRKMGESSFADSASPISRANRGFAKRRVDIRARRSSSSQDVFARKATARFVRDSSIYITCKGFLTCWGTCWVARCSCPAARTAAAAARTVAAAARPARRTLGACFARRAARTWWAARLRTGRAAEERT